MVGGIAAGGVIARFGARRMLLLGLAATALGTARRASALLASRVLEGLGFLMITVAGPAAAAAGDAGAARPAFALWSCYMPGHGRRHAGLAGLRGLACVLVVRGRGGAAGVGLRGAAGATVRRRRKPVLARLRQDTIDTLGTAGPVLLSLTFMLYSLMFFALFSFLPVLLMERLGLSLAQAGLYSAIATVANVIGNLGAGMLLARGWRRSTLIAIACASMALIALLIFRSARRP